MTLRKLLVEWVISFCWPTKSCLRSATWCLSLKRLMKVRKDGNGCVEPLIVRWESKTGRVKLCEVGGVSLPLIILIIIKINNIAEISWRLTSRCLSALKSES